LKLNLPTLHVSFYNKTYRIVLHLSWDITADVGFLCRKAVVLRERQQWLHPVISNRISTLTNFATLQNFEVNPKIINVKNMSFQ